MAACPGAAAASAELIVDPAGRDDNPGTRERPLATLAGAKAAVRRQMAAGVEGDITVLFRGGTYALHTPVVFGPEDSARGKQVITYAAYPGEVPVFSGGRGDWWVAEEGGNLDGGDPGGAGWASGCFGGCM